METYCADAPLTVEQLVINAKIVPDLGAPLGTLTCMPNKMAVECAPTVVNVKVHLRAAASRHAHASSGVL